MKKLSAEQRRDLHVLYQELEVLEAQLEERSTDSNEIEERLERVLQELESCDRLSEGGDESRSACDEALRQSAGVGRSGNRGNRRKTFRAPRKAQVSANEPRQESRLPLGLILLVVVVVVGVFGGFHKRVIAYVGGASAAQAADAVRANVRAGSDGSKLTDADSKFRFDQILNQKCFSCHGGGLEKKIKGDLDIASLLESSVNHPDQWSDVYRSIQDQEMPPDDEPDALPLEDAERTFLLAYIEKMALRAEAAELATSRPLTPIELEYTFRDVFDFDHAAYRPFKGLYSTYATSGFHTHQENVFSPYYLNEYYHVIDDVLGSFVAVKPQLDKMKIRVNLPKEIHRSMTFGDYLDLRWSAKNPCLIKIECQEIEAKSARVSKAKKRKDRSAARRTYGPNALPPGTYTFRFNAEALNIEFENVTERSHGRKIVNELKQRMMGKDGRPRQSIPVDFFLTPPNVSDALGVHRHLTTIEISGRKDYVFEFTLNRASGLTYGLGVPMARGAFVGDLVQHLRVKNGVAKKNDQVKSQYFMQKAYDFPHVKIHDARIVGPYDVKVHALSFDRDEVGAPSRFDQVNEKVRLFQKLLGLRDDPGLGAAFRDFQKNGMPAELAYRNTLATLLMDPEFLVLSSDKGTPDEFTRYASYSLLKSAPDEAFARGFASARRAGDMGAFGDGLMKDKRFNRFLEQFTYQWLSLGEVSNNKPDRKGFSIYYNQKLQGAYQTEVELFLKDLFLKNRPVRELVRSNHSFMSSSLENAYRGPLADARKKGRSGKQFSGGEQQAHGFVRTSTKGMGRSGILSMGAFLTATGNGVDPLPIKRAAWISEYLLDAPLPPPPDVDAADFEAAHQQRTLRERLAVHAGNAACSGCHKRIDHFALIMDQFDTIGGRNPHYHKETVRIGGQAVGTFRELTEYLAEHEEERIARAFTRKLAAYILGRKLSVADEARLDAILVACRKNEYRVGDLYKQILNQYFL